ncbi:hypothetical protein A2818_02575 [Candidatus Nomurabacteria bacterium RIFCSPHIGHO2_01_FULL_40_12]|uniref:MurNAc-LAA domain-containing protein n=1 Tax=Candidatus Nomurabacteria bacterium RIFCSPHIGHO2_01_FULL_40_12 TaxID=1801737 RepID=A0A1F6V083_9BACT|nr:MAG: hypothetical protein A2818_02575 [Candidatus Nomurabacteria bacterium RIFCSPHIGHO2_01_FULL_40_12]
MNKLLFIFTLFSLLATPVFSVKASEPIKILLIPGHDDEIWGAQYGNIKEADMNLSLATELFKILEKDKNFDVHITREKGGYTQEFKDYFSVRKDEVLAFKEASKIGRQNQINNGDFIQKESNPHLNANADTALRLYGFNKWANDNKIDVMIHIHFNDYPRKNNWTLGKYKGFVIYVPEGQMVNSRESALLGANIFLQLKKKYITSTYEKEKGGLIPDQTLIALGANNTLLPSVRSILIEYGYIYRFKNNTTRKQVYKNMAKFTAKGIKEYFSNK